MASGSSVEIGVDTITKLTQLVALHGVYAVFVIFMFYLERRARENVRTANKGQDTFFRRQYTAVISAIFVLSAASIIIWTYSTFFYEPKIVIEGTFKGLIEQPKPPTRIGDSPLLIDTIVPFKSDDKFFTVKKPNIKTDSPDIDWILVAPSGEKTMLFAFEQQYEFIKTPDPEAIRVADSTGSPPSLLHESVVLQRFASIDFQVHPSLRRSVVHLLYIPNSEDRYKEVGKLFVVDGDNKFTPVQLVDEKTFGLQSVSPKTAYSLFGATPAWAEVLEQGKPGSPLEPDVMPQLSAYLSSQDLQKQLQARDILANSGAKAFPIILQMAKNGTETNTSNRSLLIHNLASVVDKIESSGPIANPELHATLGKALYELGDYKAAYVQFEKTPPDKVDPSLLLIKGAAALNSKNYPTALSTFNNLLERTKDPHIKSLAIGNIGGVYFSQDRLGDARQNFNEALTLDSTNASARYNLGLLELRAEKYDVATAIFRAIVKSNPNQSGAKISLALALQGEGKLGEAAEVLEGVIVASPMNAVALNNLAFCYAIQGQKLDRALVYADRALAINGENANYLDTKGWILHRQGKEKEGMEYLKKAAAKMPRDPNIKSHLDAVLRRAS